MALRPEIERALRFIADNLERPLSVGEVARAAHLSEFHLHRVFHAALGESIGSFITRRRLELAALRLAYETDRTITDIAQSSGYSSSSNFGKAFSGYFGVSPGRVRDPRGALPDSIGKLTARHGKDFRPGALYTLAHEPDSEQRRVEAARWEAKVRFETSPGKTFACLASPAGYDFETAERTWHELIARARQLGLCDDDVDAWGIAHDSPDLTAPELCRYHACVPCAPDSELPGPLFRGQMLSGRYAVFPFAGAVTSIPEVYRSIYSCWFRESSLSPDGYTPLDHYVGDFPEAGQVELEIWFKVRPKR